MIVELEIKSWVGVSIGVHYYGVLRCPGHRAHRLEKVMDAAEAQLMNAYDNTPNLYHAGSKTERFDSAEQVRARAQEVWAEVYPEATGLEEIS